MVYGPLNGLAESVPVRVLSGLVLTLTGVQHVFFAGQSLVTELLRMASITGDGVLILAMIAGLGVGAAGLGTLGMVLEDFGFY